MALDYQFTSEIYQHVDITRFRIRGKEFAHQALQYITPADKLIYGEGTPYHERSNKGCLSVDLGYNVEESLPSLVSYGLLTGDEEVLGPVVASVRSHMEFMLLDGGWERLGYTQLQVDILGQPNLRRMPARLRIISRPRPRFYQVALRNTRLLQQCTHDGILHGGLHYHSHGTPPSIHHTFCHLKVLTVIAGHDHTSAFDKKKVTLPRDIPYGIKFFSDIQTWLVAKGNSEPPLPRMTANTKKQKMAMPPAVPSRCCGTNKPASFSAPA